MNQLKVMTDEAVNTAAAVTHTTGPMAENVSRWSQDLKNVEPAKEAYEQATVVTRDTGRVTMEC